MTSTLPVVVADINKLVSIKELCSISTLEVGRNYKILSLVKKNTIYGDRILVEFAEFNMCLGSRFNKISSDDIQKLNEAATEEKLFIVSRGILKKTVNIEFVLV